MHPELAVLIMDVIHLWAQTELAFGRVLSCFLRSEERVGTSMYLGLNGAEARRAALRAAANSALEQDPQMLLLFEKLDKAVRATRDRRNDFAHGIWGTTPEIPDALLWIGTDDYLKFERDRKAWMDGLNPGQSVTDRPPFHAPEVMVYRKPELERNRDDAREAYNCVQCFQVAVEKDARLATYPNDPTALRRTMCEKIEASPLLRRLTDPSPPTPPAR